MKSAYDIIIKPIITEQSMEQGDLKKYAFQVARDAGTLNVKGKMRRTGQYPAGRTAATKKAVVRLTEDSKTIELFEGMV